MTFFIILLCLFDRKVLLKSPLLHKKSLKNRIFKGAAYNMLLIVLSWIKVQVNRTLLTNNILTNLGFVEFRTDIIFNSNWDKLVKEKDICDVS